MDEPFLIGGEPISASLFDFGLFFLHQCPHADRQWYGPVFLPAEPESRRHEARPGMTYFSQDALGISHGTIRATVLIETILAAFEMDAILREP